MGTSARSTDQQRPPLKGTIESLQAGRGLAAFAVLLHHANIAAHDFGRPSVDIRPFHYGLLGVDFFFVLSGFIIYHSTVGRGRSLTEYSVARFRRVYLPYWPVGIAIALFLTMHAGPRDLPWSWVPTLTLAPVNSLPALSAGWTLKHEVLFYLLFGLFYYSRILPLGLGAWLIAILLLDGHVPFADVNFEFFMGIGAAIAYRSGRAPWWLMLLSPIPVIAWVMLGQSGDDRALIGAAFTLIVAPLAQLEFRRSLKIPQPLVLLGAASYSLYLVHGPLVSVTGRLVHNGWLILPAAVLAGLAGGFGYHFIVEKRVIRPRTNPEVFDDKPGFNLGRMLKRMDPRLWLHRVCN